MKNKIGYITDKNYLFYTFISLFFYIKTPIDFDVWWHLQVGKDIITGIWPSPDRYSYISNNSWVVHSWLSDILFYLIWVVNQTIFTDDLILLKLLRLLVLFSVAQIIFYYSFQMNKSIHLSGLVVIICSFLLWERSIRPFMFSPLFNILFYRYFSIKSVNVKDFIFYNILMMLWCNIHGAYIFVILFICTIIIKNIIFIKRAPLSSKENSWYITSISLVAFSFVNPHPIELLFRILYANSYPTLDWNSLLWWLIDSPFHVSGYIFIFSIVCIVWIILVIKKLQTKGISGIIEDDLLVVEVVCLILSFYHIRLIWLLIFPILGVIRLLNLNKTSFKINEVTIPLIVFLFIYFLQIPQLEGGDNRIPTDALKYINENQMHGNYFTKWPWSGYITFKTNNTSKIFVDTRIEPFSYDDILIVAAVTEDPIGSIEKIRLMGTEYVLMPKMDEYKFWELLNQKEMIKIIYSDDHTFIAKLN